MAEHVGAAALRGTAAAPPVARGLATLPRSRSGLFGVAIVVAVVLCASLPQIIAPYAPGLPDFPVAVQPPSAAHPFGTDQLGRDQLSRIVYAARVSLFVGVVAVLAAGAIGCALGLASGYFGGWIDAVVMRLADVQLSFPFLLLALTLNAVIGSGLRNVIVSLVLAGWPMYARVVRGEILTLVRREYVQAAVATGARSRQVIWRHVLPNVAGSIVVTSVSQISQVMVAEATISFLGFGVQLPTPSWGSMVGEQRDYVTMAWWLTTFPGAALAFTVLGVNLTGDWLRDALDPRRRR
ncbi:MAG TPA: ABC transporter permease [bacterium]|nr:ABC transporter permease [bacterium]